MFQRPGDGLLLAAVPNVSAMQGAVLVGRDRFGSIGAEPGLPGPAMPLVAFPLAVWIQWFWEPFSRGLAGGGIPKPRDFIEVGGNEPCSTGIPITTTANKGPPTNLVVQPAPKLSSGMTIKD